jgi:hypothetical protein
VKLNESSPLTLEGSFTQDLVFSKFWLCHVLKQVMQQQQIQKFPVAYVLGSWYGNVALMLRKTQVPIDKIVNVEINSQWIDYNKKMFDILGIKNTQSMQANANQINYRQLKRPALVINTSLNDIVDQGWFDHIPSNTMICMQGRDNVAADAEYNFDSIDDIEEQYPLSQTLYRGKVKLRDPETSYVRYMIIGVK